MNPVKLAIARLWWVALFLAAPAAVRAQLGAPNAAGVSIGHVHLTVRDVAAHKKLWTLIGAEVTHSGRLEMLKFPGLFVLLTAGQPTDGSDGSTANHFGLMVRNLDDIRAKLAGLPTVREADNPRRWTTLFPDKVMVEFVENPAQQEPVVGHHLHLATNDLEGLRAWYVKTFGGIAEIRRGFISAVFNGGEVNLLPADKPQAPTKGRSIDHIGFEVKNLEAFCRKLEASGVKFDTPYRDVPAIGLKLAFLTDPAGTRIELTEGLAGK
jgi:catechol 2,3-dioxygenase-like lactoylglutathione lyase family enzyme